MNLVTGGTGLLGSHIIEKLLARGEPVRALVRPGRPSTLLGAVSLPNRATGVLEGWKVERVLGDVTDPASLAPAMRGVHTVYHAAAQVGDWGPWERFVAVTIQGTANMLQAAQAANVKRFLHVSSISTYGDPDVDADDAVPYTFWPRSLRGYPDGEGKVLDESAPLNAHLHRWSYYSRAKVEAEKLVRAAWEQGKLPVTVVKPSWLYGPRDRASMPRLLRAVQTGKAKIIGDGKNRLNLTYAGNEAEGCILAATHDRAVGQTYNLSNDGEITLEQFLNKIATCLGARPVTRKVPYKVAYGAAFLMELFGHALRRQRPPLVTRYAVWLMGRRCFFSCDKARRELGWRPTVGYEEGIKLSVKWCLENGLG